MLPPDAPVVLLQHHGLDNLGGKTGLALLRYRSGPVLAVVDPAHAGGDLAGVNRRPPGVGGVGLGGRGPAPAAGAGRLGGGGSGPLRRAAAG
jgi:hypothetical protein